MSDTDDTPLDYLFVSPESAEIGQLLSDDPVDPSADREPEFITLPRKPFMIGLAGMLVAVVVLVFLWQNAGGSGTDTLDAATATSVSDAGTDAAADLDSNNSESNNSDRDATIARLEAELAARPVPALPGSALRRVIVAADASVVSIGNEGVAVIGPFGGYAAIDPVTNVVTATSQIASGANRVVRTDVAVWVTNHADSQIVRVDPIGNVIYSTFDFPSPDGLAKDGPTLIVTSRDEGFVARIDPLTGAITQEVGGLSQPTEVLVTEDHGIWVALFDSGEVVQIDKESFEILSRVTVGAGPIGLSEADGTLWVVNQQEGSVVGVDLASQTIVSSIWVGAGPTDAVVFDGSLWVSVTEAGDLVQIDPSTGKLLTRTPLGTSNRGGPAGMDQGSGSLWVAIRGERSVVRVTPLGA